MVTYGTGAIGIVELTGHNWPAGGIEHRLPIRCGLRVSEEIGKIAIQFRLSRHIREQRKALGGTKSLIVPEEMRVLLPSIMERQDDWSTKSEAELILYISRLRPSCEIVKKIGGIPAFEWL